MFHQKYNEIKNFMSLKPNIFLKNNISLFYNILQINQLNHILQMNILKKKILWVIKSTLTFPPESCLRSPHVGLSSSAGFHRSRICSSDD